MCRLWLVLHQTQENGLTEEFIVNSEYACYTTTAILFSCWKRGEVGGWRLSTRSFLTKKPFEPRIPLFLTQLLNHWTLYQFPIVAFGSCSKKLGGGEKIVVSIRRLGNSHQAVSCVETLGGLPLGGRILKWLVLASVLSACKVTLSY